MDFKDKVANVEDWYEALKKFTPHSEFMYISEERRKWLKVRTYEKLKKELDYFAEYHAPPRLPELVEEKMEEALVQEMDALLKSRTMFFRTSVFSPKDVDTACKVSSGREVLELITSSYRMYKNGYSFSEGKDFYFVFRDFIPNIQEEFRCFVENGEILGVSQYDDSDTVMKGKGATSLYHWDLPRYVQLASYVREVVEQTEIKTAVLDIGVANGEFLIIEINPFSVSTDKCLFSMTKIYEEHPGNLEIRYWKEKYRMEKVFLNQDFTVSHIETEEIEPDTIDLSKLVLNLERVVSVSNNSKPEQRRR